MEREVDVVDIAYDEVPEHHYKEEEVRHTTGHMMSGHMTFCHMINVYYSSLSHFLNVTTKAPCG